MTPAAAAECLWLVGAVPLTVPMAQAGVRPLCPGRHDARQQPKALRLRRPVVDGERIAPLDWP